MKKYILAVIAGVLCISLSGCQETPEESAVVSKADGLSEEVVCEPLKEGETRETDIPEHWEFEEKKSNDRVTIKADLELDVQNIGNLPVIEMKSHELTKEELKELISYFSDGGELYTPQMVTKDVYQAVLDRISNKEGSYAQSAYSTSIASIQNATREGMELAPKEGAAPEKAEIGFYKKSEDPGVEAARSWMNAEAENTDTEDYFAADVGEDRSAHIEAERYNPEIDNDSSFLWMEGSDFVEEGTIETEEMQSEYYSSFGMDTNGYTEKIHQLADAYRTRMDQIPFTEEEGWEQAEQILEDLGIDGMGQAAFERCVWFPKGACSEHNGLGLGSDAIWQGDLDKGLPGYLYSFSRSVEGLASVSDGMAAEETMDSYVPPFEIETISILITEEGVKYFKWGGIAKEVRTVTENTKLLPFEKIQAKLADQIFYWYSGQGQSANDTTLLEYDVTDAKLRYTYTTAYQEPKHAWLVPAWIFTVQESVAGNSLQNLAYVINAYDGSVIGEVY